MKLSSIISNIGWDTSTDTEIDKICITPTAAEYGALFVSLSASEEAEREAIRNGAAAVVTPNPSASYGVPTVYCESIREFYANACCKLSGFDTHSIRLIAVVGTNGKTSVAALIYKALTELGQRAGFIGTGKIECMGEPINQKNYSMTTPDPHVLYPALKKMQERGCKYVVMEVSSHALFYDKVSPLRFKLAIFTNLSHEHLDFHRSIEEYYKAKSKICSLTEKLIVNNDDEHARRLYAEADCEKLSVGAVWCESDVTLEHIKQRGLSGSEYLYKSKSFSTLIRTPLPCSYNVYNTALAFCALTELKFLPCVVKEVIKSIYNIEGRFEIISKSPPTVIDYAHTPLALESFLKELKSIIAPREIIAVFGCGGNRDVVKRAKMAEIAERYAAFTVITNDNPRTESEDKIIADIASGFKNGNSYTVIKNREEAIYHALERSGGKAAVAVIGKGCEEYSVFGEQYVAYNDKSAVQSAINKLKAKESTQGENKT